MFVTCLVHLIVICRQSVPMWKCFLDMGLNGCPTCGNMFLYGTGIEWLFFGWVCYHTNQLMHIFRDRSHGLAIKLLKFKIKRINMLVAGLHFFAEDNWELRKHSFSRFFKNGSLVFSMHRNISIGNTDITS